MAQPKVCILRAPGTNCDHETAHAFELAGGAVDALHVRAVLDRPSLIQDYQVFCLPGGFSYGDDVAAGRILAAQIRHRLRDALSEFHARDTLILGICNGFQVLLQSGLLDEVGDSTGASATLVSNESGKFEDRWVTLETAGSSCVLFTGIETLYLPVAHAEGRFVVRSPKVAEQLRADGRVVLHYARAPEDDGESNSVRESNSNDGSNSDAVPYPQNPNGSVGNIAGLCDASGRICGLMPHPERYVVRTQHPRWTRLDLPEQGDGMSVFHNAVRYFS